jgi:CheY-like chemotaxis protein
MNKYGPVILIEDDPDDQELMKELFGELDLSNEIVIFNNGMDAIRYLRQPAVKPFLIISDINMPALDGYGLREIILKDKDLAKKCIPFLFCTTGATASIVEEAYSRSVQGIFQKPTSYDAWKDILVAVVAYWSKAISPNSY